MNNYGFDLNEYRDKQSKCTTLLSSNLKRGCLGLLLGSGVSYDLKLPSWQLLVERCIVELSPTTIVKTDPSYYDLQTLSDKIKLKSPSLDAYHDLVKRKLYEGVDFDFHFAKKDLLIALSSLIVGKVRGNVNHIITYNFDSVLEWYLQINGLKVNVSNKAELLSNAADIEVTHLHGYLPHDPLLGENSDFLVFSKEEFEDRKVQYNYWKFVTQDFHRRHLFLSVGLSPDSLINDLCPYLRDLETWYSTEGVLRDFPYGVAYITPTKDKEKDLEEKDTLIRHGIIPCSIEIPNIPSAIFQIAQHGIVK
jgi:hypothetical protein